MEPLTNAFTAALKESVDAQTLIIAKWTLLATWALVLVTLGAACVAIGQLTSFISSNRAKNTIDFIDKFYNVRHNFNAEKSGSLHDAITDAASHFKVPNYRSKFKADAKLIEERTAHLFLSPDQILEHEAVRNELTVVSTYFREAAKLSAKKHIDREMVQEYFHGMILRTIEWCKELELFETFARRAMDDAAFVDFAPKQRAKSKVKSAFRAIGRQFIDWSY